MNYHTADLTIANIDTSKRLVVAKSGGVDAGRVAPVPPLTGAQANADQIRARRLFAPVL
ncbi:MAG: hypothetical protein HQM09_20005 [Candidatus Riflebacteria bacterium]|nr:hypothetical protein [Candidatus Riflebacteria bacterium]